MAKNCLLGQTLNRGTTGTTTCPNCDNTSYYYTIIGESTFDVPNAVPVVYSVINDGIKPMQLTIPYNGNVIIEFTGNIKRRITGTAKRENCFVGVTLNDILIPSSVVGVNTLYVNEQYDVCVQVVPITVITGDVIKVVACTNDVSAEKLHQVLNHNMRVIFVDVT